MNNRKRNKENATEVGNTYKRDDVAEHVEAVCDECHGVGDIAHGDLHEKESRGESEHERETAFSTSHSAKIRGDLILAEWDLKYPKWRRRSGHQQSICSQQCTNRWSTK